MNLLAGIFSIFKSDTASKLVEIGLEKTEDVDKRNALIMQYLSLQEETRRHSINRVTVPWVDAVHKMGRQIFWLVMGVGGLTMIAMGKGDDLVKHSDLLYAVLGGGGLYTVMKGKGQ